MLLLLIPLPPVFQYLTFVTHSCTDTKTNVLSYISSFFIYRKMPLLYTGRRRTKLNRKYNGPPRQGPVRHISPAQLNLERVYEQNRLNVSKKDSTRVPEPAPGPAAKGKPRLLLMGQRRSV